MRLSSRFASRSHPYKNDEAKSPSKRQGTCFRCGFKGHWARDRRKKISESEISIFDCSSVIKSCIESDKENHSNTFSFSFVTDQRLPSVSHIGHLNSKLPVWVQTGVDNYIRDGISEGYKIPFKTIPELAVLKNNRPSLENYEFVSAEIESL